MIKSSTKLLKALLLLVVAFWATIETMADSPRKVVVEQFTSTTCGPCATANPAFHDWIGNNLDYVVPFIYHLNFPAPGDPMYTHNPTMNSFMQNYYAVNGIPAASVNGAATVHPATLGQQGYSSITSLKGTISKIDMTVDVSLVGNRYTATITVASSVALNNHQLRAVAIEHPMNYTSAPGSNGETYFPWVPRLNMINSGTFSEVVSLAAGQSKTFTYNFDKNTAWADGKISVSAYVQNSQTKEVLQGETSQFNATLNLADNYLKVTPNVAKEANFTVTNDKSFELDVTMSINLANSYLPEGWTATIGGSATAKIASKQSVSSKVLVTPAAGAGLAMVAIDVASKSGNKVGMTTTQYLYLLSTDTKLAYFALSGNNAQPFLRSIPSITKHFKEYATIPLAPEFLNAYPLSDFKTIIVADDFPTRGSLLTNADFATALDNAIRGGTNVVFTGVVDLTLAFTTINGFTPNPTMKTIIKDYFGADFSSTLSISQVANNQIQLFPTTITGVSGDPISDNMNYIINQYNGQTHPYYTQWIDMIKPSATDVTPILYVQGTQLAKDKTITGIRRQYGKSRLVYLSHTFDLIQDINNRNQLITQVLNWVNPIVEGDKPSISVASSVDFMDTEVGKSSTKSIEISNTGKAPLVINKMALAFDDTGADGFFTFDVKLPLTIAAGAKANIDINFNPKIVEEYTDALEIYSNDENSAITSINLKGVGLAGTSEEPVISVSRQAIAFGQVGVGTSKTDFITISNTGKADLVINEIYMNNLDNIFTIVETPSLPLTIKSGENYELNVKFEPTAGQTYNNILNVKSNSATNASQTISLSGTGDATSVRDGVAGDDQVFTFSVGPNPFEVTSVVSYTVAASVGAQNVTMNLVDAKGNAVRNFINGNVEMGSYTLDINSAGLASGAYMLVANVGGSSYTLPVTIKK